mgnify:CR=1 FL=1
MNLPISLYRARDWALRTPSTVFYGVLSSNLIDIMDDTIETACTDGKSIKWNPTWLASLTEEEVRFVLLHETLHCANQHFWRLPLNKRGNIAGDYVINAILSKIAGLKMPKGGLLDAQYSNMAEEQVLALLPKDEDEEQEGDEGGCGGFGEPAPDAPEASQTLSQQWTGAILQADFAQRSAGAGSAPSDMQRMIDAIKVSAPDWKQEMADFVRSAISQRNDWSRSSRRMASAPCIYPRKRADQIGQIVFVRDTSGSVDGAVLNAFNALIESAMADTSCPAIVIDADYDVRAEYRLEAGDAVPATAKGGGGTAFQPAFNRIAGIIEAGDAVAGVVYLTDLEGPQAGACDLPVLWLCTTDNVADFGRTVRVRL